MAFFDSAPLIFDGWISTACPPSGEQNAAIWGKIGTLREHDGTGGRGFPSAGRQLGRAAMSEVRQTVVRRPRLAPRSQWESKPYHADRRQMGAPKNNHGLICAGGAQQCAFPPQQVAGLGNDPG